MPKLNPRTIERKVRHAISELGWWLEFDPDAHASNAQVVADRANSDVDDCIAGANYDSDGRGGAELTHPERHAERRTDWGSRGKDRKPEPADPVAERIARLAGTLDTIAELSTAARDLAGQLTTSHDPRDLKAQSAAASAEPTYGRGKCGNCGRHCPGTATDRIKADRCSPGCYEWRLRHGTDRPKNEAER